MARWKARRHLRAPARHWSCARRSRSAARLRSRLRARPHAVHDDHGRDADLGRAGSWPARPRSALVVVGRLFVADERRDPEEGAVRIAMFAAMAALLVAALAVPGAFDDDALLFAAAYAIVRVAQIVLFVLASAGVPRSVAVQGLAVSTATASGSSRLRRSPTGSARGALGVRAPARHGRPVPHRLGGLKLAPRHFAERHGLIVIIALGESISGPGRGRRGWHRPGWVTAATLGIALSACLWWLYFDVVSHVAERRLVTAQKGREQNEIARDSYSYLHFPMVAGIVLVAVGFEDVGARRRPARDSAAVGLMGGVAAYLLAHVAFRWRNVHTQPPTTHRGVRERRAPAAGAPAARARDARGRRTAADARRLRGGPVRRGPGPRSGTSSLATTPRRPHDEADLGAVAARVRPGGEGDGPSSARRANSATRASS